MVNFAKDRNLEIVDNEYFHTEFRYNQLLNKKDEKKYGTVGCVAIDFDGNIVAGTSTGGMTNKKWGRIGDSPIIGAGTYANNSTCGISKLQGKCISRIENTKVFFRIQSNKSEISRQFFFKF